MRIGSLRGLRHRPLDVSAKRQDIAAIAHRDGEADGQAAVYAEHRLRRIGEAAADCAMSLRRSMRPPTAKLMPDTSASD